MVKNQKKKLKMNLKPLYKRYKSKSLDEIRTYLKHIKIVQFIGGGFFAINDKSMVGIIEKPRNISFTFSSELVTEERNLDLIHYKTIPFLVKSSSRFFLEADIGEVFDQMDDVDINQISAIYVDENNSQVVNSEGDHFLMEAVLLHNVKQIRTKKLKQLNKK